jgi:phosphatidylglycerophosphate synthase
MRRRIPLALTTLRLLLGPFTLICALADAPRLVYLPILIVGTLSDIADGILARRLQVATPFLRRYDSVTDVTYYLFVLAAIWILCKPVVVQTWWAILILLISEAATIVVCVARFRKYPATHSNLSKFYGLCLLGGLIALLVFNATGWVIVTLMAVGLVTNAEIIAMHFIADAPPVDVPSIFALSKHRNA